MENFYSFNKVDIIGYVVNFTIHTFKSGKRKAEIGIKDELENNVIYVQMFENNKMQWDGQPTNLDGLKNIFMDHEDKPNHVLVRGTGRVAENKYYSPKMKKEMVSCKPILWKIEKYKLFGSGKSAEDNQRIVFDVTGIVDSIRTIKDDTEIVIRMGILTTDYRDPEKKWNGVEYLECYATDALKEKIEDADIERYSMISIAGDILNTLPKKNKYGDIEPGATGEKGFKIMSLKKKIVEPDDLDIDLYKKLKLVDKSAKTETKPTVAQEPIIETKPVEEPKTLDSYEPPKNDDCYVPPTANGNDEPFSFEPTTPAENTDAPWHEDAPPVAQVKESKPFVPPVTDSEPVADLEGLDF